MFIEQVEKLTGDIYSARHVGVGEYSEWLIARFNEGYSVEDVGGYVVLTHDSPCVFNNFRCYED